MVYGIHKGVYTWGMKRGVRRMGKGEGVEKKNGREGRGSECLRGCAGAEETVFEGALC